MTEFIPRSFEVNQRRREISLASICQITKLKSSLCCQPKADKNIIAVQKKKRSERQLCPFSFFLNSDGRIISISRHLPCPHLGGLFPSLSSLCPRRGDCPFPKMRGHWIRLRFEFYLKFSLTLGSKSAIKVIINDDNERIKKALSKIG